jgi:NTP pyrophosphatase (non-canonical NTP hydrolase)
MRDSKRIKPFLAKLEELWMENPDLRFGQLVDILMNSTQDKNMFSPEESVWLSAIEAKLKPKVPLMHNTCMVAKGIRHFKCMSCDTQTINYANGVPMCSKCLEKKNLCCICGQVVEQLKPCNHKDDSGNSTVKYDSSYEMRSSDMHCTTCGKEGSREDFNLKEEVKKILDKKPLINPIELRAIKMLTLMDKKTLGERSLKCCEEVGELAQAVLSATGAHCCGYKGKTMLDVIEEALDIIIVSLSITEQAGNPNPSEEEIKSMFISKLTKWYDKIIETNGDKRSCLECRFYEHETSCCMHNYDVMAILDEEESAAGCKNFKPGVYEAGDLE